MLLRIADRASEIAYHGTAQQCDTEECRMVKFRVTTKKVKCAVQHSLFMRQKVREKDKNYSSRLQKFLSESIHSLQKAKVN